MSSHSHSQAPKFTAEPSCLDLLYSVKLYAVDWRTHRDSTPSERVTHAATLMHAFNLRCPFVGCIAVIPVKHCIQ